MHRKARVVVAFLAFALALPALSAEGRIPLPFAGPPPYVLAAPGKYIVTRNLATPIGPLFDVTSPNVEIDLNGMEVSSGDLAQPVIRALGPAEGLVVRNGTIVGGSHSILVNFSSRVVIEDVKSMGVPAGNQGFRLVAVTNFAIRRCHLNGSPGEAIFVDGNPLPDPVTGTIEDNVIEGTGFGILVIRGSAVGIIHNRVRGTTTGVGIFLSSTSGSLVAENTLEQITGNAIFVTGFLGPSTGNKLFDNVVHIASDNGIHLAFGSADTFVLNNVITRVSNTGIRVETARNNIEGNTLNINGDKGLWLMGGSADNVFRRNMGRGNAAGACFGFFTGDLCNDGVGNTSAGDNFLPFLL